MATDTRLSDDDIRAAARVWFRNFGSGFRSVIDDLKPGVFREFAPQYANNLLNPQPNEIYSEPAALQRKMAAIDGLEMAGYSKPFEPEDIERMLTAMQGPVSEYVEAAWQKLTGVPAKAEPAANTGPENESENPDTAVFSEKIEEYFVEKQREGYTHQTIIQQRVAFRYGAELIGDKAVIDYRRTDAGKFRETLLRLPASFGKGQETALMTAISMADAVDESIIKARQESPKSDAARKTLVKRMTGRTVKRHFSAMSQYWQYLSTNGLTGENNNIFIGWPFPGTKKKTQKRDIWVINYLRKLFTSEYWQSADVTSAIPWLPLIALHSGMRADEIASLRLTEDIQEEHGILFFRLQEHGFTEEFFDEEHEKWRTKTIAGIRRVPVHSWLIQHGIKELIALRQKQKAEMLFPDLTPSGPDGKRSASYSREFSRKKQALRSAAAMSSFSFALRCTAF